MINVNEIVSKCKSEIGGSEKYIYDLLNKLAEFERFHNFHVNLLKAQKRKEFSNFESDSNSDSNSKPKTSSATEGPKVYINPQFLPFSKGVVLSGEPGCGKTKIATLVSDYSGFDYKIINGTDFFQPVTGASERRVLESFQSKNDDIRILILENIDILFESGKVEERILSLLIDQIDKTISTFIIATTNRISRLSKTILRSNRLDRNIHISISTTDQRVEVLKILTKKLPIDPLVKPKLIESIASQVHGYSPSDLQSLSLQAFLEFLNRVKIARSDKPAAFDQLMLELDFESALRIVRPASLQEYVTKIPRIYFSDIYGMQAVINNLMISVIQPLKNIEKYRAIGIDPPKGILIHGPPGVGKSMLSYAIANEAKINIIFADGTELRSMIVGNSERAIQKLFYKARSTFPCIIVFDHFETLAPSRDGYSTSEGGSNRIVTTLLTEIDGFNSGIFNENKAHVVIIAVSNRPQDIDPALLRPGRIDVYVKLEHPNDQDRVSILEGVLKKIPNDISNAFLAEISEKTDGWTGSELSSLCQMAAMISIREDRNLQKVNQNHLSKALKEFELTR